MRNRIMGEILDIIVSALHLANEAVNGGEH